jgi:hypothetical protein
MPTTYSTTMLPDLIGQDYDARRVFQTLRTPPETASDQTRPMSGTNILWTFKLGWQALTLSGAEQLLHGFEFLGGPTHGMYWYDWLSQGWLGIPIGTGDGTNKIFTLPVKGASSASTIVRVNNVASGGSFSIATGANGEDVFTLATAPAAGVQVRADFTGRRRRKVRFTSFRLSPRHGSSSGLWTAQAELLETEGSDL